MFLLLIVVALFALANSTPSPQRSRAGRELRKFGNVLYDHQSMVTGDSLESLNSWYGTHFSADGILSIVDPFGRSIWSSPRLHPAPNPPISLRITGGNNLVIVDSDDRELWATNTTGRGMRPARLLLQNDGKLVLEGSDYGAIWDTVSGIIPDEKMHDLLIPGQLMIPGDAIWGKRYYSRAEFRDGAITIKNPTGKVIWSTDTTSGTRFFLKYDCDLVLEDARGRTVWSSNTANEGEPPCYAIFEHWGEFVVYDSRNRTVRGAKFETTWTRSLGNTLFPGDELKTGDALFSSNGQFKAILQTDGNFVVSTNGSRPIYETRTSHLDKRAHLRMSGDNNVILFDGADRKIWHTRTMNRGPGPARFTLENDGRLAIYGRDHHAIWNSKVGIKISSKDVGDTLRNNHAMFFGERFKSENGQYAAGINMAGSFVVSSTVDGHVLWETGTKVWGTDGVTNWQTDEEGSSDSAYLVMQDDNNLVLYNGMTPIWATITWQTAANGKAELTLQNSGRLIMYVNGEPVWTTSGSGRIGRGFYL